ncbi:MAG TPA: IS3 family transposase [Opitutaceae bacterium]
MIDTLKTETGASVRRICTVLGLPRSSYYHAAAPPPRRDDNLVAPVGRVFHENRSRYGYRRIARELMYRGLDCGCHAVRRIMRGEGLQALQPRHFVPRTSDGKASRPSPNLLSGAPPPEACDRVWAGDITFIPCIGGWLYLAVVIDLFSRKIIGWKLACRMDGALVAGALEQAIRSRHPHGTIFHSDRGSQYSSNCFREVLRREGLRQSMSGRANPYDNATTESFIGTLKSELPIGKAPFKNLAESERELFAYIDAYYNTRRLHSSLGYRSPSQFEAAQAEAH